MAEKPQMLLAWFTQDESFPLCVQKGHHEVEMPLHNHINFSELVIVLSGSAVHTVQGQSYMLRKGEVFVINEDTEHAFTQAHDLKICNIMFRRDELLADDLDIRQSVGFHALFMIAPTLVRDSRFESCLRLNDEAYTHVTRLIDRMQDEFDEKSTGWKTILQGYFQSLVVFLSRCYEQHTELLDVRGMRIALPMAYIEQHFTQPLTTRQLADMAGFSPRHFDRIFMDTYHLRPKAYITRLRMNLARQLLMQTKKTVTEIAFECGYSDSNYFTRVFRGELGLSPTEWRRHIGRFAH